MKSCSGMAFYHTFILGAFPITGNAPNIIQIEYVCNMKIYQTTIFDLAKELNISKSTVSRALTNHPNVHPDTRKAVLELAEKLDYQRNMIAIRLSTHKSNTIGVLIPEFMSSYFPLAIIGIQEEATKE